MATTEVRTAALAVRTKTDLKNFLHDHIGLTLTESRQIANAVCSAAVAETAAAAPLTKAGVARAVRDYRQLEQEKLAIAYAVWADEAHKQAWAYTGPWPEGNDWVEFGGEKRLLDPLQRLKHMITLQLAEKWLQELDACADDDELEAALVRRKLPDHLVEEYIEKYGKGEAVTADAG